MLRGRALADLGERPVSEGPASPRLPAFPECVPFEEIRSPLAPKALFPESTVGLVSAPVLLRSVLPASKL